MRKRQFAGRGPHLKEEPVLPFGSLTELDSPINPCRVCQTEPQLPNSLPCQLPTGQASELRVSHVPPLPTVQWASFDGVLSLQRSLLGEGGKAVTQYRASIPSALPQSPWTRSSFCLLESLMPQLLPGLLLGKTQEPPHLATVSLCQPQSWAPLNW